MSIRTAAGVAIAWLAACTAVAAEPVAANERETAAAARRILDAWHADAPEPGDRRLHVICWRPRDRDFPAGHKERLDRMLTHIARFYAREMERLGFGPRTIRLDRDPAGKLRLHEVVGADTFADYGKPDGNRIRRECLPVLAAAGIDLDRETCMIFTNLATWDPQRLVFSHKSPYYAGGDHKGGTAWQLDSPELDVKNLPLRQPVITDGEYGRIPLGRHNSIFIGGMAHELGHALGLPHCHARDDEARRHGTALMGSGNRTYGEETRNEGKGSFLTLADGLQLAAHPQFSGSVKGMRDPARASLADVVVRPAADGKSFTLTGRVTGTPPIHGVAAYLDPEGGGDYDARTATAAPGDDGRFTLRCAGLVPGKPAALRIVACHTNGGTTEWTHAYTVAADGTADVEAMRLGFALDGFLDALDRRDQAAASRIQAALPADGRESRIAGTILAARARDRQTIPPADAAADVKSLPLSAATPVEAKVGWSGPAFDHLPRREALLVSAGRVFERGIYAHAPASHRYDLGGRWTRLRGACGLPTQRGGSVVFVVRGDGRELFRSQRLGADQLEPFDLDVTGVRSLELRTEDAGDGNTADWATWFEPELTRN